MDQRPTNSVEGTACEDNTLFYSTWNCEIANKHTVSLLHGKNVTDELGEQTLPDQICGLNLR